MIAHSAIAAFARHAGSLSVNSIPVDRLAERVGSTPFFAYDRGMLTRRIDLLRGTLPPGIDLSYAVKANPMPAVVQHLSGLVDSFDVACALEMRTALDTPMPANPVSFAGPGKTSAELSQAVGAGATTAMKSENEADRVRDGDRGGLSVYALDLLGGDVPLPRVEIGDLIALFQADAYGLTASPTAFLSHAAPAEVLI